MNKKTNKITLLSLLLSISIIISTLEFYIPSFGIPGVKLGLANIVTLIILYKYGYIDSLVILILRILIVNIIRGTIFSYPFFMILSGGLLSYLTMIILHKTGKFSEIGISTSGAIMHSFGQIIVVCFITEMVEALYYLPIIIIFSVITGIFVGIVSRKINSKFDNQNIK